MSVFIAMYFIMLCATVMAIGSLIGLWREALQLRGWYLASSVLATLLLAAVVWVAVDVMVIR